MAYFTVPLAEAIVVSVVKSVALKKDNANEKVQIVRANAIIAVAGMEGALASVLGGLVSVPVIAVPTSIVNSFYFTWFNSVKDRSTTFIQ